MADRNGYIGRAPADSAVTVARQTFSPTGVTTDFTFASGYVPGYFDIFINGVKMIEGSDYTSTDGSTFSVLNGGATSGDVIEGVAYKAFNAATASVGIYSGGDPISTQANILNFVGTGNTFALRGSTVDISISGGAGAGGTFAVNSTGIHTTKSVGIGTTTATGAADTNNTAVLNVGIVTANSLFGTLTGDVTGDVTGTATGLSGSPNITINNLTGVAATFTGVLTYEDVTNVDSVGLVTARSGLRVVGGGLTVTGVSTFFSNAIFNSTVNFNDSATFADDDVLNFGASSDGRIFFENSENEFHVRVPGGSGKLTLGAGPTVQITNEDGNTNRAVFTSGGANITGVVTATGSVQVGSGQSFGSSGASAAVYYGDGSNLTGIAVGLNTEAGTASGIVTHVRLSSAQDHKITATGFTTITSSGDGTEGESHTIRIVNSGIATVGFSTYFLFPSGSAPTMPTADGAISLISFTVHDSVGAGCTQLLAGASVNYS